MEKNVYFINFKINFGLEKGGIDPSDLLEFSEYIVHNCPFISLSGIMCIGRDGIDTTKEKNPDFLVCSDSLCINTI